MRPPRKRKPPERADGLRFRCASCDAEHDLANVSLGAAEPVPWRLATDAERSRSELGDEQCVLQADDGIHCFVRACLDIPVRRTDRCFNWGVWVSLSQQSFREIWKHWNDPRRMELGPYFGWLCTAIPGYPDTLHLKTHVHQRAVGLRPLVELEPTDHPLAVHQRKGIGRRELAARVMRILHP